MTRTAAILCVVLAACGRIGFDDRTEAQGDDAPFDAPRGDAYAAPVCATGCSAFDYCGTAIGSCGGMASCRPLPVIGCPQAIDFVCACDGTTYVNDCAAEAAGASIDHVGPCTSTYVPSCTPACNLGDYCYTPTGMCGQPGTCVPIPPDQGLCMDLLVCGCDSSSYGNACLAAEAGMSIANTGACQI